MFGDARRAVVIGAGVVFVVGFLVGVAVGRSGRDAAVVVAPRAVETTTTPAPTATLSGGPDAPAVTPTPGREPALATQGAILREGTRPVVSALANVPCQALVTPGVLGECGQVPVADSTIVWVVERTPTTAGGSAFTVRLFTFVPASSGWVEWLQASDPTGERWTDVNVLAVDLTADGVPELVFGFRDTDERSTLELDVVGYSQDGFPVVLAHPADSPQGVVVSSGGNLVEYVGQYPNQEPACCPASYLAQTIAFEDAFFRIVSSQTTAPSAVPTTQV